MRKLLAALALCLWISGALADPFEDGVKAYERGDYAAAFKLWKPLADQGTAEAQGNLGLMYDNGQGVPQDYAEALKWYRKAADQGEANAQFNLGVMYSKGQGVPQEYVEAHKWYNLSAARATEKETRDMATGNRDIVAAKMTPAQVAEAQKLARDWKPTTAP